MPDASPPPFFGLYYDGATARARSVRCTVSQGQLHIQGDGVDRTEPIATVTLSDQLGSSPRKLSLPDGASVEAPLSAELALALGSARGHASWVARLEARWLYAVLALIASMAFIAAGYIWGLPLASKVIAQRLSPNIIDSLGEQTMKALDGGMVAPSRISTARQQNLKDRLRIMRGQDAALPPHTLLFRDGRGIGANALALPNGNIVVTDQLMALATNDDQVLAVIGHELGHLQQRHALRGLIQGSILAAVAAWYAGDISALAVGLPVLLLQTGYSREFEREADRYGANFLLANGLSPALLAEMLERLESAHKGGSGPDYFSTHPDTAERAAALRRFKGT